MKYSSLTAGDKSPIPSFPVPGTCATSRLCNDEIIISINIVQGDGFDKDAVGEGQIDIAIEKEGPMAFFLLRFQTLRQISYLMAPFDALNTPEDLLFACVMKRFASYDGIALRIWTQDEVGIIQDIRHTKVPAKLQSALTPIVRRQMRKGRPVGVDKGSEFMLRFIQRTGFTPEAFEGAEFKARVT